MLIVGSLRSLPDGSLRHSSRLFNRLRGPMCKGSVSFINYVAWWTYDLRILTLGASAHLETNK